MPASLSEAIRVRIIARKRLEPFTGASRQIRPLIPKSSISEEPRKDTICDPQSCCSAQSASASFQISRFASDCGNKLSLVPGRSGKTLPIFMLSSVRITCTSMHRIRFNSSKSGGTRKTRFGCFLPAFRQSSSRSSKL